MTGAVHLDSLHRICSALGSSMLIMQFVAHLFRCVTVCVTLLEHVRMIGLLRRRFYSLNGNRL